MLKSQIHRILGGITEKAYMLLCGYKNQQITKALGGGKRVIHYPFHILGEKNIITEDSVSIGVNATIFTTNAKVRIKQHFVSGPNLTIITGDHMPVIGKFLDTVTDEDKEVIDLNHRYDQDVTIEEDVWCGVNVTILKGVTIGRGAIIAAGSIVTKNIPPYCIAAGIPARPIRTRWTVDQILEHERNLYDKSKRLTKSQLESFVL